MRHILQGLLATRCTSGRVGRGWGRGRGSPLTPTSRWTPTAGGCSRPSPSKRLPGCVGGAVRWRALVCSRVPGRGACMQAALAGRWWACGFLQLSNPTAFVGVHPSTCRRLSFWACHASCCSFRVFVLNICFKLRRWSGSPRRGSRSGGHRRWRPTRCSHYRRRRQGCSSPSLPTRSSSRCVERAGRKRGKRGRVYACWEWTHREWSGRGCSWQDPGGQQLA